MTSSRTPQIPVVPRRGPGLRLAPVCLLAVLGVAACRDAPTDPVVDIVAGESAPALQINLSFADPEGLIRNGEDIGADGLDALSRWHESWMVGDDEGRVIRENAYPALVAGLAPEVLPEDLKHQLDLLGEGLRRADQIPPGALTPVLSQGLRTADAFHAEALSAAARGDVPTALDDLIRGGDALREVGPEAVARSLEEEVRTAYGRFSPPDTYPQEDRERLQRLVHGASEAIEQGAWVLAIRRAYYARALLDAAPER